MSVVLVVARADNGIIGRDGELPWRIAADLRHFRAVTLGHPVIMGRRTFDSIGRALPGRRNIVLSRDAGWSAPGAERAADLGAALAVAGPGPAMVIGGGEVYAQALPLADRIELTEVHLAPQGDARFPELDPAEWEERSRTRHAAYGDTPAFSFVSLFRRERRDTPLSSA